MGGVSDALGVVSLPFTQALSAGVSRSQQVQPAGYLGFFQFVHNTRQRGKALLGALVAALGA